MFLARDYMIGNSDLYKLVKKENQSKLVYQTVNNDLELRKFEISVKEKDLYEGKLNNLVVKVENLSSIKEELSNRINHLIKSGNNPYYYYSSLVDIIDFDETYYFTVTTNPNDLNKYNIVEINKDDISELDVIVLGDTKISDNPMTDYFSIELFITTLDTTLDYFDDVCNKDVSLKILDCLQINYTGKKIKEEDLEEIPF